MKLVNDTGAACGLDQPMIDYDQRSRTSGHAHDIDGWTWSIVPLGHQQCYCSYSQLTINSSLNHDYQLFIHGYSWLYNVIYPFIH